MTEPPVLSLRDLRFGYDAAGPNALRGLSLDIPAGATTVVLGANGAGKTTLLHVILGLLSPQGGEVWIAGRRQTDRTRRESSRLVAMVPQNEHIPFDLSVLEYVLMGRSPHIAILDMPSQADYEIAVESIEAMGLQHLSHRAVPELSGGERQLATMARALAQRAPILLLDEPAAHLDLGNTMRLLGLIDVLAKQGNTVVFTSHDPSAAASVAHTIVLMRDGQVLATGPTESVFTSEHLTLTYGVPVRVATVEGLQVVLPGRIP
jgi:iron complex transport system ATP-binding protein